MTSAACSFLACRSHGAYGLAYVADGRNRRLPALMVWRSRSASCLDHRNGQVCLTVENLPPTSPTRARQRLNASRPACSPISVPMRCASPTEHRHEARPSAASRSASSATKTTTRPPRRRTAPVRARGIGPRKRPRRGRRVLGGERPLPPRARRAAVDPIRSFPLFRSSDWFAAVTSHSLVSPSESASSHTRKSRSHGKDSELPSSCL